MKAVKATSATSSSETQRCSASSHTAFGIGVHAFSSMVAMALVTAGVIRAVREKCAPAWRAAATTAWRAGRSDTGSDSRWPNLCTCSDASTLLPGRGGSGIGLTI